VHHDTSSAAGYRPAAGATVTCISCGIVANEHNASKAKHLETCGRGSLPYGKMWRKNA
jgi:hypothetical protein